MLNGSGSNGELTFIDWISLLSFVIGLENLEMNISQTDLQEETKKLDAAVDNKMHIALSEIHEHLKKQDIKINAIIEMLNEMRAVK